MPLGRDEEMGEPWGETWDFSVAFRAFQMQGYLAEPGKLSIFPNENVARQSREGLLKCDRVGRKANELMSQLLLWATGAQSNCCTMGDDGEQALAFSYPRTRKLARLAHCNTTPVSCCFRVLTPCTCGLFHT